MLQFVFPDDQSTVTIWLEYSDSVVWILTSVPMISPDLDNLLLSVDVYEVWILAIDDERSVSNILPISRKLMVQQIQ